MLTPNISYLKRSFGTYPKIHNCRISGLGREVIMELIEGEPLVSKVSTEPGETNQTFHDKITGNNTENTELGEETIFFDVIFYVRMKDGVSRIINFALNKN